MKTLSCFVMEVCSAQTALEIRKSIFRTLSRGRDILILVAFAACPIGAWEESQTQTWAPNGVLIADKLPSDGNPICLSVHFNSTKRSFLVDTGCPGIVITADSVPVDATKLGETKILAHNADLVAPVYSIKGISVGGLECPWIDNALALDLSHYRRNLGVAVDGVLGMEFLYPFILHLDFDNRVLLICDPLKVGRPPGTETSLTLDDEWRPKTNVSIGQNHKLDFIIDTGLIAGGTIEKAMFARLCQEPGIALTEGKISRIDATGTHAALPQLRCNESAIGSYGLKGQLFESNIVNALGLSCLCRYRITLDFRKRRAYWVPGNRIALLDRGDYCGLFSQLQDDGTRTVVKIAHGSLAERSGLKDGDHILEVNGDPIVRLNNGQWNGLLSFPTPNDIRFTVRRGAAQIVIRIPGG
jgi:hypothetical protein